MGAHARRGRAGRAPRGAGGEVQNLLRVAFEQRDDGGGCHADQRHVAVLPADRQQAVAKDLRRAASLARQPAAGRELASGRAVSGGIDELLNHGDVRAKVGVIVDS